ncbi:hypothetical protein KIPB_009131 [Kipferlia bialata]|uniref:Leucine-rich repeat-containing N-terminal plant-type domain-containing protein n=1 Tax=Kipferlia bialata TaxID=797122 RepID=A0A9K3GKE2_9EUKA|nr:hypothetical protein KIPB_009131 [Kipferlia bialata]|eukprot:g9131.t1
MRLLWSLYVLLVLTLTGVRAGDKAALEALYTSTNGDLWTQPNTWLSSSPHCDWEGVTCNADGAVVALDLSGYGLTGTLPPEMAGLTYLKSLYLNDNLMSTPLPPELCLMENMQYVQMVNAGLTGSIPECVCEAKHIQYLYLSSNSLSGSIPACEDWNLRELHLDHNMLEGPVPTTLADTGLLSDLWVQCNKDLLCTNLANGGTGVDYQCGASLLTCGGIAAKTAVAIGPILLVTILAGWGRWYITRQIKRRLGATDTDTGGTGRYLKQRHKRRACASTGGAVEYRSASLADDLGSPGRQAISPPVHGDKEE